LSEIDRIRAAYTRRAEQRLDERYSLLDPANLYLFQRREQALLSMLRRQGLTSLAGLRILDVGCGSGEVLNDFVRYGADPALLAGVDLLEERIERARRRNPAIAYLVGNAESLPCRDGAFDVALQFTLLSSVLDARTRRRIAGETLRVLAPDGLLIWYDFIWNPTNRDVRGIRLGEIRELYPGCSFDVRRITLAPPLLRRLAPVSPALCRLLEAVPFLRSHYLVAIQKESTG
jgi:ubiquinone/menaquinone biosynthesis C-methylase UbiE